MEDIRILEAVERYIAGQMSPDERVYFEQLRKSNSEVDQLVVEHTFFLQQLNRFDEVKRLKNSMNEVHIDLAEKGLITSARLKGKAKVVYLVNKYKRVAAIAASIAGITTLAVSVIVLSLSPVTPAKQADVIQLNRKFENIDKKVDEIEKQNQALDQKINDVKDQSGVPPIAYKTGGTGFLIDPKGYLVTNAHIVKDAKHVAVQGADGKELSATTVFIDLKSDIALLKITERNFKTPGVIPYSLKKSSVEIAEPIFTLGFPRNDIVYGDGYIAAKTGFDGDTLTCQLAIAANRGNSGSPIINRNGEIVGMVNTKQTSVEGAVFAVQSKYIYRMLSRLQKADTSFEKMKLPVSSALKGQARTQQVKKISDFVYMVKVD